MQKVLSDSQMDVHVTKWSSDRDHMQRSLKPAESLKAKMEFESGWKRLTMGIKTSVSKLAERIDVRESDPFN